MFFVLSRTQSPDISVPKAASWTAVSDGLASMGLRQKYQSTVKCTITQIGAAMAVHMVVFEGCAHPCLHNWPLVVGQCVKK